MKIGLYIAGIKPSDGGIYQHSIFILKMLLASEVLEQFTIFLSSDLVPTISPLVEKKPVKLVVVDPRINRSFIELFSNFWLKKYYLRGKQKSLFLKFYKLLNPERRFYNKFNLDVLHVPKQHSPVYRLNYPVVITMHDVQQLIYPEYFTPLQRIRRAISYYISIEEADRIIVSYQHVKDDLEKYFREASGKISVCAVPVNNDWLLFEEASHDQLVKKYNLPDSFILTPAATWEHKNHIAILGALKTLKNRNIKVNWIATGLKTEFFDIIEKKISEYGLSDQVNFTGIVSDSELRALYSLAKLVVIPTRYEAGSTPLFEAMRYKIPVICSNITSLPDTIKNPEFIFDPDDHTRIAELIEKGLTDSDFIERNIENSINRMKELSDRDYTASFFEAYREALLWHSKK